MRLFALALTIAALLAAQTASASTDPRKCPYSTSAKTCTQAAAIGALKLAMDRRNHVQGWDANLACASQSAKFLVWRCVWTSGTPGSATITFRALSNGWHTSVVMA